MGIFNKFQEAWEARDITSLAECFTPDWEFHMHSSGAIIKLDEWKEFFGKIIKNPDIKNKSARLVQENEDIIVMHSIGTFQNGSKDAVMYVGLKKGGKIYKSETGSTLMPD